MSKEKECFRCRRVKPLEEFYAHRHMADGHLNKCKECTRRDVRRYRRTSEAARAYDRKRSRTPERRAHIARNAKQWEERYPERKKAQTALNNAVRDGRIEKPAICERCRKPPEHGRIHGHHHDYSKPLEVEWVCPRCHAQELREKARNQRGETDASNDKNRAALPADG